MPQEMNYGEDYKYIPQTSIESGIGREVLADLYMYTTQIANVFFVGSKDRFVIVDAGMPRSREEIISEVEQRFSEFSKPEAIVLTHGHFDHVGFSRMPVVIVKYRRKRERLFRPWQFLLCCGVSDGGRTRNWNDSSLGSDIENLSQRLFHRTCVSKAGKQGFSVNMQIGDP